MAAFISPITEPTSRRISLEVKFALHENSNPNPSSLIAQIVSTEDHNVVLRGYVDTGSAVELLRQSDAKKLGIECKPNQSLITGCEGGKITPLG